MLLRYSSISPFAKKVRVVAAELGITDKIKLMPTVLRTDNAEFFAQNPLAKIPVLVTDNGLSLSDSKVICEYLDTEFGQSQLIPTTGDERWQALTDISLADGMVDAGLLARQATARSDETNPDNDIEFQMQKVARSLDRFNARVDTSHSAFHMKEIALACALEWIVFRFGTPYTFDGRDKLATWYNAVKLRPSMSDPTIP